MATSTLLAMTQGFGMNLVAANIPQLQGPLGATSTEAVWLMAAYMAPNASLSIALIKIRNQYGLRHFAELGIAVFLVVSLSHLFVTDMQSAIVLRFFAGIAAAPLSSLGFLYMLEAFSPARKLTVGIITRGESGMRQKPCSISNVQDGRSRTPIQPSPLWGRCPAG